MVATRRATEAPRPLPAARSIEPSIAARNPNRGLVGAARAVKVVWQREMIRFTNDRLRIFTSLLQPVLYIFVLGTGLSALTRNGSGSVNLRTFIYPGALGMAVMFTAVFSAASIVWDREFGFLREMLVAPISRASIVVGKCLGGATVATLQGVVVLTLAGLAGVPYTPTLMLALLAESAVLAFTLTAFGVMAAARVQTIQGFMGLTQMFLMPLFFTAGAMFPLSHLPTWLAAITRVNPLTYAIDPMRRAVFAQLHLPAAVRQRYAPGVTWGSYRVPTGLELLIVFGMGLAMLGVGVIQFRRAD